MKRIRSSFILGFVNGIAILTPVIITILIIRFLVSKLNEMILNPLMKLLVFLNLAGYEIYLAKGIILILAILLVGLVGWGGKIWVIRRAFVFGEQLFMRIPLMGKVYNAIKQIIGSLVHHRKSIFKRVVLIEFPRKGLYSLAFVTGMAEEEVNRRTGGTKIHVFVPKVPNPATGFFLMVAQEELIDLEMSVENGLKLVISGGVMSPVYTTKNGG